MQAYVDESGDTGNTSKSSKLFSLTAVMVKDGERLEKDVKNYLAKLIRVNKKRPAYFHAHKEDKRILKSLIDISVKNEIDILCHMYNEKTENMYKKSLVKLLIELETLQAETVFVASYISKVSFVKEIKNLFPNMNIKFVPARNNKGLQVADCYSYIIYNGVQGRLNELYTLIKNKIKTKQNP